MQTLFADACFLIGCKNKSDQYHKTAKMIWNNLTKLKIVRGFQDIMISDYVLVEIFQGLQSHGRFDDAISVYSELIKNCKVQSVTESIVHEAIEKKLAPYLNHRTKKPPIGLVDATSLVIMDKFNIPWILSFDEGFDQIPLIKRVHNEDTLPSNQITNIKKR